MKKLIALLICGITVSTTSCFAFAGSDIRSYYKDNTQLADLKGKVRFENDTLTAVEGVKDGGSVSTTNVRINTQEISGNGTVTISNNNKTSDKDIYTPALVHVDVGISAPLVHGNAKVEIENNSETEMDNVNAGYIYIYNYNYSKPVYIG